MMIGAEVSRAAAGVIDSRASFVPPDPLEEDARKERLRGLVSSGIGTGWELGEGEVGDKLEVKVFGTLKLLMLRITEMKEEHKARMKQLDVDKEKLSAEDKKQLAVLAFRPDEDELDEHGLKRKKSIF